MSDFLVQPEPTQVYRQSTTVCYSYVLPVTQSYLCNNLNMKLRYTAYHHVSLS